MTREYTLDKVVDVPYRCNINWLKDDHWIVIENWIFTSKDWKNDIMTYTCHSMVHVKYAQKNVNILTSNYNSSILCKSLRLLKNQIHDTCKF